ncbi:MAG: hypothetical protein SGJ05_10965 [bacterium]|nr:hypothetical protein [bacterium]
MSKQPITKTEKLNSLYDQWIIAKPEYASCFIRDGIIDEVEYDRAKCKILYVGKEPNHSGGQQEADFRSEWRRGEASYPFAYRIGEWTSGMLNGFPAYQDAVAKRTDCLRQIAFLNVKKSGGGRSVSKREIDAHVDDIQLEFLHCQLNIIDPDIVVLGLGFNQKLLVRLFPNLTTQPVQTQCGIMVAAEGKRKIIDFYHPSYWKLSPSVSYGQL